jgi:Cas7 group CRISPR-associated protein Csh2
MSISKKIDFAVVLTVKNANPNGDPLNGNRPRVNYDGLGEISDVCIKRKIRNRLMRLKGRNPYLFSPTTTRWMNAAASNPGSMLLKSK